MSRQAATGVMRLWYVAAIAAPNAPTVAELTAGIDLTPQLVRDSLNVERSATTYDASDASSRQDKQVPGTIGAGQVTATFQRDSVVADDDAWTTLTEDAAGFLVKRSFGGSATAPAAAQKLEVYPGVVNTRRPLVGAESQRFESTWSVNATSYQDATVAA